MTEGTRTGGVIFLTRGDRTGLAGLLNIGGISLLERQIKTMSKSNIHDIIVSVVEKDDALMKEVERLKTIHHQVNIELVTPDSEGDRGPSFDFDEIGLEKFIVLDGSVLLDNRIIKKILESKDERVCLIPEERVIKNSHLAEKVVFQEELYLFSGCAYLSRETLKGLKVYEPDQWVKSLQEVINLRDSRVLDLSQEETYNVDMRRDLSYIVFPVSSPEDAELGKSLLIEAAQKKVLDWPAWFVHRPIENWIINRICETSITPNQITVVNVITGLLCALSFAMGNVVAGLALALSAGIIDGLDGKQARVKLMTSPLGEIEHTLDKINENGWYGAMAYSFSLQGYGFFPWILFAVIFSSNMIHVLVNDVFRKKFGRQFDDYGPFERAFRQISGRQNIYMWGLIPFVAMDAFYAGYWAIAVYAFLSISIQVWRLGFHIALEKKSREGKLSARKTFKPLRQIQVQTK